MKNYFKKIFAPFPFKKLKNYVFPDLNSWNRNVLSDLNSWQQNILTALSLSLLKNDALSEIKQISEPLDADQNNTIQKYSLGFGCNLANNAYTFCKIARKKGVDANLFLESNFTDNFVLSQPIWEEVDYIGECIPGNSTVLPEWVPPEYVNSVEWRQELTAEVSKSFEYERLQSLFEGTGIEIKREDALSYLLNYFVLPHRDILKLYHSVDVSLVSGAQIGIASFSDKPYVTFPYGADLFTLPFEENQRGWMQIRGFRKAARHIVSGGIMLEFMDNMGISRDKIDMIPFMIDTDVYAPIADNPTKEILQIQHPGRMIFFIGSRQNWIWKGNDKLWRAISNVVKRHEEALFLTVWYGQDTTKSDELIKSLGISENIIKVGVLSKKALRKYIDAADVCIDQFTHGGLGTFSLESMSSSSPLITYYTDKKHFEFQKPPPVLSAFSEEEIAACVEYCIENQNALKDIGVQSREWIKDNHGYDNLWPQYDAVYRRAIIDSN